MEKDADVVVIGGGISGCAIAYNLAKRGSKVVLVEKGEIASEASGRTGASIRQQGRNPKEIPPMRASVALWEGLEKELRGETGFIRSGNLYIAQKQDEVAVLESNFQEAKDAGLDARMLTAKEVKELVPPLESPVVAGLHSPNDGFSDCIKSTYSFANAAKEHGAKIYTQTRAIGVGVTAGRVSSVMTEKGEVKTPVVVNAAGVHAPKLAKMVGVHIPIKIVRAFSQETEPCPPAFRVALRAPQTSGKQTNTGAIRTGGGFKSRYDHDIGFDDLKDLDIWLPRLIKFRQNIHLKWDWSHLARQIKRALPLYRKEWPDLDFPVGVEPRINHSALEYRRQELIKIMPFVSKLKIAKRWAGLLDLSPDLVAILGEVEHPKGFIVTCGFSGHGWALGPITGKLISELILDGKPSISLHAFRPSRFAEGDVDVPARYR
ncbi:MAG: FAD-binding oxidoreductase [Chloroflexi bacterium]|nr:FAD-binding oxidoreductase [Chloroflexota bacterium]